jgi:hypothetical protein
MVFYRANMSLLGLLFLTVDGTVSIIIPFLLCSSPEKVPQLFPKHYGYKGAYQHTYSRQ